MEEDKIFDFVVTGRLQEYIERIQLVSPRILNAHGQTILQVALAYRHYDIVHDALARKMDVNNQDSDGMTALHYAAGQGVLEIAEMLVAQGGDINIVDKHGNNALWTAALSPKKNYELLRMFKACGGDAFHKNRVGRSAYDFAVQTQNQALIEVLSDGYASEEAQ